MGASAEFEESLRESHGGFLKGFKVFQDVQRGFRGYQGTIIELIEGCGGFKCFKALQGVSVDIRG